MEKIKFERPQIEAIYDEVDRRLCPLIQTDNFTHEELRDERCAMMQGVYSALSACASNWPEVRQWIDEIEDKRNWWG